MTTELRKVATRAFHQRKENFHWKLADNVEKVKEKKKRIAVESAAMKFKLVLR